ncbi:MAG: LysM peptidoglycan-binding domain-containing protein [Bacteroidales bacterium]|nr:LysM peptidoglycan-binding domain-containing protein [Bacteroidales bacterium]
MRRITLILILLSLILNHSFAQSDTVIVVKSKDKVIIGGQVYYVHIVKKGETLFSLSNAYDVTQKEIAKENPEIFLGFQIGQALKIPFTEKDNESNDRDSKKDFIYHRVKKGQTLYSLSKKYNVSQEDIIACNPTVRYGVNENQIVKIPKSKDVVEAIQFPVSETFNDTIRVASQFIYYTVKTKDTVYSLTRFYNITEDILIEHNPFVSGGLKVGQILKIPAVIDIESATVLIKPDEESGDTILYEKRASVAYSDSMYIPDCEKITWEQNEPYQVALLLPFYLDKNDEEFYVDSSEVNDSGEKIYEKVFYNPFHIYPRSLNFVEFYEGFLMAVDSLKQNGLSINLHVYDTEKDTARIREILSFPEFGSTDLIIGPIYSNEIKLVSGFSKENHIKMISPLSDNLSLVNENPYLFQVYPSHNSQIDEFAKFISGFGHKNIVLVHNGDSLGYSNIQMVKDKIFNNLSIDTLVNNIQFKEVVFVDSINVLEHALNEEIENVFIIPSNEEAFVTDVVTNLNTLKAFGHQVSVVGLSRWQRFRNIDPEYYFNLELCIASPFFIDYHERDVKNFILKYRDIYRTEPNQMAIHAYDVGLYFLTAMMYYGKNFEQCIYNHSMDLLQADYRFVKWYKTSGYENVDVDIIKYFDGYNIFRIDDTKKSILPVSHSFE